MQQEGWALPLHRIGFINFTVMNQIESVYKVDPEWIKNIDIDSYIANEPTRSCQHYITAFVKAAKSANAKGNTNEGKVLNLIKDLSTPISDFSDPLTPYQPMMSMGEKRSFLPEDLCSDDIPAVRALAEKTNDPSLKARLYDTLWLCENNYQDCKTAANAFLESAEFLDASEDWTDADDQYQRGLQLAAKLGREKETFQSLADSLVCAVTRNLDTDDGFRTCSLLRVALEGYVGDAASLADVAKSKGAQSFKEEKHRQARHYWQLEASFRKRTKDLEGIKAAEVQAAETLILEAELRANQSPGGSYMAAASKLQRGIEALRRVGGQSERVNDLRRRLADYQQRSMEEMGEFSTKIDLSEPISKAQKFVSEKPFFEALTRLGLGMPLTDLPALQKTVEENIKKFPLSHIFEANLMDEGGRTIAKKPSLMGLENDDASQALQGEMYEYFTKFMLTTRTSGFIIPAKNQIVNDHHPTFEDLHFLVTNNPFVPEGHEEIFLRGLHAGFHDDWLLAGSFLTPQIENSIRNVLENSVAETTNLHGDGTQTLKGLDSLLSSDSTKELLGESACFELRALLIEKRGGGFRDSMSHGYSSTNDFYSNVTVNIWWLVLRLCIVPIMAAIQNQEDAEEK